MKQSLWKKGKKETSAFYDLKIKGGKSTLAFLLGILLTLVVIYPVAALGFQLIQIYGYLPSSIIFILIIGAALLLFANGLSNVITVELTKIYYPEIDRLQRIDTKAVFVYQSLNIGFAAWIIIMILLLQVIIR